MRILEIIESKEHYNWELHQKGFDHTETIGDITYRVKKTKSGVEVTAKNRQGKNVGSAWFVRHQYKDGLESQLTQVDPKYRGQGIATNMYALVRMLGANIQPATSRSDDGKAMWDKWRKQGDVKHLTTMNPRMGPAE
jgi:GNAT superfamily N-acetyltransferase